MSEEFFPSPSVRGTFSRHCEKGGTPDEAISSPRHCEIATVPDAPSQRQLPVIAGNPDGLAKQSHFAMTEDVEHRAMTERANKQSRLATNFLSAFLGGILALTLAYVLIAANIVKLPIPSTGPTVGPTGKPLVNSSITDPDWGAVADAVKPSTVTVRATGGDQASQGAGFILDERGHVVTNAHVIAGHNSFSVQLNTGFIVEARIAGVDTATDIAVLTMDNPPSGLQPASLGDSSSVYVGEPVAAVGNPLGLSQSVSTGIVSATNRPVSTEEPGNDGAKIVTNAIQVDAATNEGNSGGALVDGEGRVIGVTSALASASSADGEVKSSGIGFAIPINLVKKIADQLISTGVARHAHLGVTSQSVWIKAGDISQLGAQVKSFDKSSPAQRAGIQVGDTIISVGNYPVVSETSLMGAIHEYQPGDVVTLRLVRDANVISVDVKLAG